MGRDLGVRYVLEGSVRKAGDRVRMTAQLIEAETGNHIWAEGYDRELKDIFELQDEITLTIAAAVEPELASFERGRALRKPTEDLEVWDLFHRATAQILKLGQESMTVGAQMMREAIAVDPQFGQAYAYLAFVDFWSVIQSRTSDIDASRAQAFAHAQKALSIDPRDYFAHWILGRLHAVNGDHQLAIRALETSISINPNFAMGYNGLGAAHLWAGHPEEAIKYADVAIRLSPHDPYMHFFISVKGMAYGMMGDLERNIEISEQVVRFPAAQFLPFAILAGLYGLVNRLDGASAMLERARSIKPDLTIKNMENFLGPEDQSMFCFYFEGFRKVGLT